MTPEKMTHHEDEQPTTYKAFEREVSRDTILERAATILSANKYYPDSRGERANMLWAEKAIMEALKENGINSYSELRQQIQEDAHEVLGLV